MFHNTQLLPKKVWPENIYWNQNNQNKSLRRFHVNKPYIYVCMYIYIYIYIQYIYIYIYIYIYVCIYTVYIHIYIFIYIYIYIYIWLFPRVTYGTFRDFFKIKRLYFRNHLFLDNGIYLYFRPKKNILICSGRILDNFSSFW